MAMNRKVGASESRDLRSLRKLAHARAAQIGAPDRARIDLEEVLGVPVSRPQPTPGHAMARVRADLVLPDGICPLRLLAELQLRAVSMLAAPVISWSRMHQEIATCYLNGLRRAMEGMQQLCRAVVTPGGGPSQ
jgi:hypothetical protein